MIIQFKGLDLGDGSDYIVTGIDGWESRPEVTNGSAPRPHSLGSWVGGLGSQKRVISLDVIILGLDSDGNQTTIPKAKLRQVTGLDDTEQPLLIGLDYGSTPEIANVRVTAFEMSTNKGYGRRQSAVIEFTATDPRKYSNGVYKATTGLPTTSRANLYPLVYGPFPIPPTAVDRGEAIVENLGNAPTPVMYRIIGPSPQPSITVTYPDGKQKRTIFNTPLATNEVLEADTVTGMVTVGGGVRTGQTSGALVQHLELPPGQSTITLGGLGNDKTTLSATWRDATL